MKKILKSFGLATAISAFSIINPAHSYEFTVTNVTGQSIAVQIYGVIVGNMMDGSVGDGGLFSSQRFKISNFGNTSTIRDAGHLHEPYKILPGHTVTFNFSNWDRVVCFDLSRIKVGLESTNYSMPPAQVVAVPSDWYNSIFKFTHEFGGNVAKVGDAVANAAVKVGIAVPDPEVAAGAAVVGAVGTAASAFGGIVDAVGSVVKANSCRSMDFIAVPSEDGTTVKLLTQQM